MKIYIDIVSLNSNITKTKEKMMMAKKIDYTQQSRAATTLEKDPYTPLTK